MANDDEANRWMKYQKDHTRPEPERALPADVQTLKKELFETKKILALLISHLKQSDHYCLSPAGDFSEPMRVLTEWAEKNYVEIFETGSV